MSAPFKLFYSPTSCGAASFLTANYAGLNFEPVECDVQAHKVLHGGADFYSVNPKGNVPTLLLPNGQLNENISVLLYLADQARSSGKVTDLAPAEGSLDRYLFINLLSFLATELHKGCYFRLFSEGMLSRHSLKSSLMSKLKLLNDQLMSNQSKQFIFSNNFTVADAYLITMLKWNEHFDIKLTEYAALEAYYQRCEQLPQVREAERKMKELHEFNSNNSHQNMNSNMNNPNMSMMSNNNMNNNMSGDMNKNNLMNPNPNQLTNEQMMMNPHQNMGMNRMNPHVGTANEMNTNINNQRQL